MPYTTPTREEFLVRYPIFTDKADAAIDLALLDASGQVDTSWLEKDYQPAIMHLAAHYLATGNSEAGEDPVIGEAEIASESFGGMSISYASNTEGSAAKKSTWGSTIYGQRYYSLLMQNRSGPVVI